MKDLIDFLKLPPTILSALSIVSGCIIFLPDYILDKLGLINLENPYKMIVSIIFLLATALLMVYLFKSIYKKMQNKYFKLKLPKIFANMMLKLSEDEKMIIMNFYQRPDKTYELPINNGTTIRLETKLIIQKTGTTFLVGYDLKIPFTLTPITVEYIESHPEFFQQN